MPKTKLIKVGVLMGGPSSEHEVSLTTARNVLANLDKAKYQPIEIKVSKQGKWFAGGKLVSQNDAFKGCHVVFNAMHGTFGEDGKVQAILDHKKVKYTGSGVAASALAMDKFHSREIFKLAGFDVPKTLKIKKGENYNARVNFFINKITNLPVVVKPCANGSSFGVSIVENQADLSKAIDEAFACDDYVLLEEFIKGREVTCGVIENHAGQTVFALPVTEIVPLNDHKFFDYGAKYQDGQSNEITPAQIDDGVRQKVQDIAVRAHQVLGCRSYSRTDMIIKNGGIYVLETNTLPGLTPASLLPKAVQSAGLTMSQLLDIIIESSLV